MAKNITKKIKPAAAPKVAGKSIKPCRALEVGHRSCDCGGEYCSFNAPKK